MATYNSFEDLPVWQSTRELGALVYKTAAEGKLSKDYGLRNQIQRAVVSIMNNIAEGYERKSDKEFERFLYISKGSCGEVRSMLYIAHDLKYISKNDQYICYNLSVEISKLLSGFIKSLKK